MPGAALVLAYGHIVIQVKNNTDTIYFNLVAKALLGPLKPIFVTLYGRLHICI